MVFVIVNIVHEKMQTKIFSALLGALLIAVSIEDSLAYSKYGRNCKDIGCQSDETCVMREDPCSAYTSDKCGRYPTCQKVKEHGCASIVCGQNEYCKSVNGVPKCVERGSGNGYESAGVTYVNGQRISGGGSSGGNDAHSGVQANHDNHNNPYANANAPPIPPEPSGNTNYHRVNTGSNLGYPPYPNSDGSSNNNNGYPSYPTNNQGNQQYHPIYPSLPGQPGYPAQGNPVYPQQPGQQYPGGQRHPSNQYPGYQNPPYQNYPQQNQRGFGYNTPSVHYGRPNGAATIPISIILASFLAVFAIFA